MMRNQKAAGYIRIDSNVGSECGGEAQKSSIESFGREKGVDIVDYYIDVTDQSTPLDERSGYSRLNRDILSGRITSVVAFSFDRFTWDNRELQGLIHEFAEKGVDIYITSTGQYINPSAPITKEQRLLSDAMRKTEKAAAAQKKERKKGVKH